MRIATRTRPENRASFTQPAPVVGQGYGVVAISLSVVGVGDAPSSGEFVDANTADALSWTWTGGAVTSWKIKWGTSSGVYTQSYTVADPNARAAMFNTFLTTSGNYYIAVFGVDAGGEGDHTDEVAVSYTA
jgi:hypothetical protein